MSTFWWLQAFPQPRIPGRGPADDFSLTFLFLMSTPSPGFVISIFHIKESSIPLPPLQLSNYSKGWWNHLCVINYRMSFSLKACVWDCFRMRGYDAQIFLGFLHLRFGFPDTHLSMGKYSRLQLSSLAACLFGTATQHCFQTQTSMPMCMCGNTAGHAVCRTNEPRWLGLTVLWVFAYTRAVRYWQKGYPYFLGFSR